VLSTAKPFEAYSTQLPPEVYGIDSHFNRASSETHCSWRRPDDASVLLPDSADMREGEKGTLCSIYLLGCLTVIDADGVNCTPKSQKARALIAMLVLAPRGARSRVWLRDKLWSDRGEVQGAASLRQALVEVRKALRTVADHLLVTDNHTVSFDLSRASVDVFELLTPGNEAQRSALAAGNGPEFLEGFDIGDPEFEEWLTLERQVWLGRLDNLDIRRELSPKTSLPHGSRMNGDGGHGAGSHNGGGNTHVATVPAKDSGWTVALLPAEISGNGDKDGGMVAARLTAIVVRALLDAGSMTVLDLTGSGHPDAEAMRETIGFSLRLRVHFSDNHVQLDTVISSIADQRLAWLGGATIDRRSIDHGDPSAAYPLIAETIDRLQGLFHQRTAEGEDGSSEPENLYGAIHAMFRLSRGDLERAEKTLRKLIGRAPSARAYAWLSFLLTFKVGQRFSDQASTAEEAQYFARKALELDHGSATVMALVGHVHSYLFGEYDFASGLFERAIQANPAQVLAWDLYSMLHAYVGQPKKGLALANWGRHLGSHSPYRYYFDTSACINAALSGNHREAIAAGEQALRERPSFNSLLRYLVSSHAHQGDFAKAHALLERLSVVEPGFSIGSLIEARYPILQTEGGAHVIAGLRKAGVTR
jgi:tetratricopeptide (TPR) repeat protein